jgi:hypothetical protein
MTEAAEGYHTACPTTTDQPCFAEGTPAMVALEAMVDKVGLRNVLFALAHIANAKAEHVATNWQDCTTAKVWAKQAAKLDGIATTILFADC